MISRTGLPASPTGEDQVETAVSYQRRESVATITMDDGKVNALSLDMLEQVGGALDRATADRAAVLLTGRPGIFSAGFDLDVLRGGGKDALAMVKSGFELAERILSFPTPVVIACPGHAIAMGSFLVLSADYRIGVSGTFRLTANEVAIGITMPRAAIEICRQRLTPAAFNRAVVLADVFSPDEAVAAGFLDRLVPPPELSEASLAVAERLAALDGDAHRSTKLRARAGALRDLRAAIERDDAENAELAP
jgi:enoyl-CoA hydratase